MAASTKLCLLFVRIFWPFNNTDLVVTASEEEEEVVVVVVVVEKVEREEGE